MAELFKNRAKKHQIDFKKNVLNISESGEFERWVVHPKTKVRESKIITLDYFLPKNDAELGLNYVEYFRDEIKKECKKFNNYMRDGNMLRSEHIPLNIFIPMREDKDKVAKLFNCFLEGNVIKSVENIYIEKAGNKGKENYLDDGTSFDTRIDFTHIDNTKGYLGIEVKYTEKEYKIKEESKEFKDIFEKKNDKYFSVTDFSNYYSEKNTENLILNTLGKDEFRQIWRNHILGASMIKTGEIKYFYHVHLYPAGNEHFQEYLPKYRSFLSEKGEKSFKSVTYEELFSMMEDIFNENEKQINWINYLKERYLID